MQTEPSPKSGIVLPALRARMGDWWYYVATMTFADVARFVKRVRDIREPKELKTWIQRELRPERTKQIADYLRSQPQRFFNAIVVGVYGGEPEWLPVTVGESLTVKDVTLGERQTQSFGLIRLTGNEEMFAVDGQHRVEGIKEAVREQPGLGGEEQVVIFVAHKTSPEGRQRTRRLFSTLNKYAKPVSQSELVALSEDDAFAIVTRRLIDEFPGLGPDFVPLLPSTNIPVGEKKCVTSVVGLYELTKLVSPPDIRKERKRHETGPPSADMVGAIYRESESFWNALKRHIPPIRQVCASVPGEEIASKYRNPDGGHLLFRPVGLKAFAKAARVLMDRGETADRAVTQLSKANLQLDAPLWMDVVWRPQTRTVLHKYVRLAQNVLLHEVGAKADNKNYSVLGEYKRITGRAYPRA